MSDVNANIGIQFDTANALAQLRQLQAGLSKFNQSLTEGNVAAANAQKGLNAQLVQSINATGKFVASQKTIASSTTSFTDALEKNKLSMSQYFKFTGAAATMNSKMMQGFFSKEKEILTRASKDRVKALQTQYVQLTNANGELVKVLQVVPKHLNMVNGKYADYATRVQMAAQRQQFLNQLIRQGSTQLLNFGKNTQWAGRQLMVGLTIPLTMLGSTAAKVFREMEMAVVSFSRVYGDMTTGIADTDKAVKSIQLLAKEFTKYGIAATDTVNMAAKAAAMGLTGNALTAQVTAATKLAVLGQVEQQQALETTISLQNAFGISADELAKKINYLNAVENQTVLSIEDLTIAIPKAGPVVKQLGGSVEDLAFFMTAMKEGGINASEGANALKSGLASIINPSKKVSETLAGLGVNLKGIVNANAGDLKGTVLGVARALDTLAPLERSRAIEQLFGKFQFARISTLFQNITNGGSQASKAFALAGASVEELAILSERELGKVENAVGVKFQKSIEQLKLQLVPIGKAFLEAVTPVVQFAGKLLEKFNNLSDGTKKFVVGFVAVLGGIAPIALMTFGLIANGAANLMKFFGMLRGGMAKLNGQNNVLGGGFDYLTQAEIDNLAQTQALHTSHQDLITTFNVEAASVNALATAYANASSQARSLASGSPGLFNTVPGATGAVSGLPKKFAQGGVVPGTGNGDTVPSMLTPGEVVLSKPMVKANPELVAGLLNGNVKRYAESTNIEGGGFSAGGIAFGGRTFAIPKRDQTDTRELQKVIDLFSKDVAGVTRVLDALERESQQLEGKFKKLGAETLKNKLEDSGVARNNPKGTSATPYDGEEYVFAHAKARGRTITDAQEIRDLADASSSPAMKKSLQGAANNGGRVQELSSFGFMMPKAANIKGENGNFEMGKSGFMDLFSGPKAERTLSPIYHEWARANGNTLEEVFKNPQLLSEMQSSVGRFGTDIADEISKLPENFGEEDFYAAVQRAVLRVDAQDEKLTNAINNLQKTSNLIVFDPSDSRGKTGNRKPIGKKDTGLKEEYGLDSGFRSYKDVGNTEFLQMGDQVEAAFNEADRVAESQSPSRRSERLGRNIVQGLENGLSSGKDRIKRQSAALIDAAIPTKVDTGNKAFYDDLNKPELLEQRQILKSQDRRRRKLGARGVVRELPAVTSAKVNIGDKQFYDRLNTPETRDERQNMKAMDRHWKKVAKEKSRMSSTAGESQSSKLAEEVSVQIQEEVSLRKKIVGFLRNTVSSASRTNKSNKEIANSSDASSKSSVALLEAEQSSLSSSRSIADSKTTQLTANNDITQGTVTESQLQDAIVQNKQNSVTSGDNINSFQDSSEDSEREIAAANDKIEADKKAQAAAGRAAVSASSALPEIPTGAQTSNKYINPATAMGYEDAYNLAGTFTRDKNGSVLMDPEFNAPTTLSKKALGKKVRGMRADKVRGFSGKMSGGLGTAAMVAGMAGAPPAVTGALGTAATVAQFAPMIASLSGPQAAVAGLVALGVASKLLNERFKAQSRAQAKYIREISVTTEKMKKMGAITGKVGSSEIMAKRREGGSNNLYTEASRDGSPFGTNFLSDQMGKDMVKSFVSNMEKVGAPKAAETLSLELAGYISDGVLSAEQANSIATAIGVNLKNTKIGVDIQGNLLQLVGPDGKDLKDNPISARTKLLAKSQMRSEEAMSAMNAQNVNIGAVGAASMIAGGGILGYGLQQNRGTKEAAQLAALDANNIGFAQAQADAVAREYADKIKILEAEKASTTNKQRQVALQEQIAKLTAEEADAASKMNVQVALSMDSALKRFEQIQVGQFGDEVNRVVKTLSLGFIGTNASNKQSAYFESLQSTVTDKYKGTAEESAAKRVLERTKDLDNGVDNDFINFFGDPITNNMAVKKRTGFAGGEKEAQRFQAQLELMMSNGTLTPSQTEGMLDLFAGNLNTLKSVLDFGVRVQGAGKTTELIQMFGNFKDKKLAQTIIANITAKNPAEFDKMSATINKLSQLDGTEIDMEVVIKTMGLTGLASLQKSLDGIEALETPITKEAIIELDKTDATDFSNAIENWDYYKKLDPVVRKEAIQAYSTLFRSYATEDPEARRIWNEQWARNAAIEKTGQFQGAVYEQTYKTNLVVASQMTTESRAQGSVETIYQPKTVIPSKTPGPGSGGGGGKGDNPLAFLDELAMRIKMVRDQSFNAQKPIKSMLEAFRNPAAKKNVADMFKLFDGLQQRLIALKAPKEFRDMIAGMSADDLEKLKNADSDPTKSGKQSIFTYGTKKDKNGKVVEDRSKVTGFTESGKAIMAAYNEAPLNAFNIAQREIVQDTNNQFKAFTMLKAAGVETNAALAAVEDTATAASLASGQLAGTDLKTFVDDTNKANTALEKSAVLTELVKKNADFKFKTESLPKLASAMKLGAFSMEQIQAVLSDPGLAKQLMDDLADGKIDSEAIMDYLNNIDEEKYIEIKTKFNAGDFAGAAAPGMELVNKMFDTQETLLRNGVSSLTKDVVEQIDIMRDDNIWMQEEIQRIQIESLKPLEDQLSAAQRSIEINITRRIEEYQKQIDTIQRNIELAFDRPIQEIQDRNTVLSNDMSVMANAAEKINEKYDKQVEALDSVEKINQRILRQQQQQIGLADALSSGDIAAAARAAQEMRSSNASDVATSTREALQQARQAELDAQTGSVSGLTKKQIEEEQYQNSQKVYALENARLVQMRQIRDIQDQMFIKEQERLAAQANITSLEDKIYDITQTEIKPLQDQIAENDLRITQGEREIQTQVDLVTVLGQTRDVWDKISSKIDASALAGEEFDRTMGVMLASVEAIDSSWDSILDKLDSVSGTAEEVSRMRTQVIDDSVENDNDVSELYGKSNKAEEDAKEKYETLKAQYEADYARLQASKNMGSTVQAYEQAYFNKTWAKGAPTAPVFGPTAASDNPNASYNNPANNAADKANAANLKGVKTFTGNSTASGGSSGSGGSGGGSGSGNSNGGDSTSNTTTAPSKIMDMKVAGQKSLRVSNAIYGTTEKGFKQDAAETNAKNLEFRNSIEAKYGLATDALSTYVGEDLAKRKQKYLSAGSSVKAADKEKYRQDIETLIKKDAAVEGYYSKSKNGQMSLDSKNSLQAQAARDKVTSLLPDDAKAALEALSQLNSTLEADKAAFKNARSEYVKIKTDNMYGEDNYPSSTWSPETIKSLDPKAYAAILPSYKLYSTAVKTMTTKGDQGSYLRQILKKAGYSSTDFDWYFRDGANYLANSGSGNKYNKDNKYGTWTGYSSGGLVASSLSSKRFSIGTDTVPAMLTPGEFVMSKYAVNSVGVDNLKAINSGAQIGDSVYNYNLSVNVRSDANPDDIARTVIAQIKQVESQRIRGVRV